MARTVGIGIQSFEKIRQNNYFYIDKTAFIKEWWENGDEVTLIARPRRFGKTLNISMLESFFSVKYAGRSDLFEGLSIWQEEKYRKLQGSFPVISLTFANVKETDYSAGICRIQKLLMQQYEQHKSILEGDFFSKEEKEIYKRMMYHMAEEDVALALYQLSDYLCRYYGKKVIIFLDEYDTPMQEAWIHGYWDELVSFIRGLFHATFKTNPNLDRGIMTGITRVSKESFFSDLNHLEVVTTTSDKYATAFGFTEKEVYEALEECRMGNKKECVKEWYDGFIFGNYTDIYNPWSIINFLDKRKVALYWANTSSNALLGKLIREGEGEVKMSFEKLLMGEHLYCAIDEQIIYNQLTGSEVGIWSLLLASGYLKVISHENMEDTKAGREPLYELALTNKEVHQMFLTMVREWFGPARPSYNNFIKALLLGDVEAMNLYINRISQQIFSSFDTGKGSLGAEPERFYHGFVLGLMVDLQGDYLITSNRESGFGRYDVMLEPRDKSRKAFILEFKVHSPAGEKTLQDTVQTALRQIEEKEYAIELVERGIPKENICSYGFAF